MASRLREPGGSLLRRASKQNLVHKPHIRVLDYQ